MNTPSTPPLPQWNESAAAGLLTVQALLPELLAQLHRLLSKEQQGQLVENLFACSESAAMAQPEPVAEVMRKMTEGYVRYAQQMYG